MKAIPSLSLSGRSLRQVLQKTVNLSSQIERNNRNLDGKGSSKMVDSEGDRRQAVMPTSSPKPITTNS